MFNLQSHHTITFNHFLSRILIYVQLLKALFLSLSHPTLSLCVIVRIDCVRSVFQHIQIQTSHQISIATKPPSLNNHYSASVKGFSLFGVGVFCLTKTKSGRAQWLRRASQEHKMGLNSGQVQPEVHSPSKSDLKQIYFFISNQTA